MSGQPYDITLWQTIRTLCPTDVLPMEMKRLRFNGDATVLMLSLKSLTSALPLAILSALFIHNDRNG